MSESRNTLEQILQLLLSEDSDKAEALLHEYMVRKARAQYELVLESDEEDELDEDEELEEEDEDQLDEYIDRTNDLEDDLLADEDEIYSDETGIDETEDEMDSMDDMDDMDSMGDDEDMGMDDMSMDDEIEGEDDIEGKVDELEAEIEDLKAEFEKLLGDDMGDDEDMGMDDMGLDDEGDDMEFDDEESSDEDDMEFESFEYDVDDSLEEATKLSNQVGEQPMKGGNLKGSEDDNSQSPFTKAPKHSTVSGQGKPVKAHDGSEGKKNDSSKNDATHHNIKVDPKKAKEPARKPAASTTKSPIDGSKGQNL